MRGCPTFEIQGDMGHVLWTALDVPGSRGGDGNRFRIQSEIENCQVVDGEVPDHINVRLEKPEIDPRRVVVVDVSNFAAGDELSNLLHGPRVDKGMVDHESESTLACFL